MGGYFRNWQDKNIIKFLEENNFTHISTHGDDCIYYNKELNATVKVTSPQKSTPVRTMLNIVRCSGVSRKEWLRFRNKGFK